MTKRQEAIAAKMVDASRGRRAVREAYHRMAQPHPVPPIQDLIVKLCHRYCIDPRDFLNSSFRGMAVSAARRDACRELREKRISFAKIGELLGGLHHTSVMHHCGVREEAQRDEFVPDESGVWA